VPFVAEATGVVAMEIEEDPEKALQRDLPLRAAGVLEDEPPVEMLCCYPDPRQAFRRRLTRPFPSLIMLCSKQPESGRAVRDAERKSGTIRAPMIVFGDSSLSHLLEIAREVDGDVAAEMPITEQALLEIVLRLLWPNAFAQACADAGIEIKERGWPKGTAPAWMAIGMSRTSGHAVGS
jgi:hypothetical protein